jgi:hypothetical protein
MTNPGIASEVLRPSGRAEDIYGEVEGVQTEDPSDDVPHEPGHAPFPRIDLVEEARELGGQRLLAEMLAGVAELPADGHVEVAGELASKA